MSDGRLPAEEVTLTIRPQPRSAICGTNARISRIEAITLSSHWQLPVLLGQLVERLRVARAGVVDEDVRRPAVEPLEDLLGRVERGHVDPVASARRPARVAPSSLEQPHGLRADAAAAAGHDRDAARQSQVHPCMMPG